MPEVNQNREIMRDKPRAVHLKAAEENLIVSLVLIKEIMKLLGDGRNLLGEGRIG